MEKRVTLAIPTQAKLTIIPTLKGSLKREPLKSITSMSEVTRKPLITITGKKKQERNEDQPKTVKGPLKQKMARIQIMAAGEPPHIKAHILKEEVSNLQLLNSKNMLGALINLTIHQRMVDRSMPGETIERAIESLTPHIINKRSKNHILVVMEQEDMTIEPKMKKRTIMRTKKPTKSMVAMRKPTREEKMGTLAINFTKREEATMNRLDAEEREEVIIRDHHIKLIGVDAKEAGIRTIMLPPMRIMKVVITIHQIVRASKSRISIRPVLKDKHLVVANTALEMVNLNINNQEKDRIASIITTKSLLSSSSSTRMKSTITKRPTTRTAMRIPIITNLLSSLETTMTDMPKSLKDHWRPIKGKRITQGE